MVGRNPARYLAPIMLVATIAGVYLIVHHSATVHSGPSHQHQHRPRGPKFYIVKPGDNLTSISIKTSVPLATIQQLNPSVDPNTLRAGRRLKLRR